MTRLDLPSTHVRHATVSRGPSRVLAQLWVPGTLAENTLLRLGSAKLLSNFGAMVSPILDRSVRHACQEDSIDQIQALQQSELSYQRDEGSTSARPEQQPGAVDVVLLRVGHWAMKYAASSVLRYALDEGLHIADVRVAVAGGCITQEMLELLQQYGWDINAQPNILNYVLHDEAKTRWCVPQGALVATNDPTFLDQVARFGDVNTFRFMHAEGARLGPRVLHIAARMACHRTKDVSANESPMRVESRAKARAIVRYLVEELHADVNGLDYSREEAERLRRQMRVRESRTGPPLCHCLDADKDDFEVVRYLLAKGADPHLENQFGKSAMTMASNQSRQAFLETVQSFRVAQASQGSTLQDG